MASVQQGRPTTRKMTDSERQVYEDLMWGFENETFWEKYRETGGSLAIVNRQVVAEGLDPGAVFREAMDRGFPRERIALVTIPRDPAL